MGCFFILGTGKAGLLIGLAMREVLPGLTVPCFMFLAGIAGLVVLDTPLGLDILDCLAE
ncbi:MAG: hypothetical protein ACYS0I_09115 [Planctomycetota bacterium]|jgi:hypothetical protein